MAKSYKASTFGSCHKVL